MKTSPGASSVMKRFSSLRRTVPSIPWTPWAPGSGSSATAKKTVKEIIDQVVAEFEVDHETAEKDVVEFIEELMQKEKSLVSLS